MFPSRYWREMPQRYRLEAGECDKCGYVAFPPRLVCPKCGSREFTATKMSGEGELLTYTVIHVGPSAFADQTPYALGIVKLDNGANMTAQLADVDLDNIEVGGRYRIEFRKLQSDGHNGIHAYGYKLVPAR